MLACADCTYAPGGKGSSFGHHQVHAAEFSGCPTPALWHDVGPDNALWFEAEVGKLGRITISGEITEYSAPGLVPGDFVPDMTVGPDGNIWYGNGYSGAIERFEIATGKVTEFAMPATAELPNATSWADISWFAVDHVLCWLGSDGSVNRFPVSSSTKQLLPSDFMTGTEPARITPWPRFFPHQFITGPDGNVWFTDDQTSVGPPGDVPGEIVKVMPDGSATEFPIPQVALSPVIDPTGLTVGPDGNIWFTVFVQNTVGEITPEGQITQFSLPADDNPVLSNSVISPVVVITGPDGNLWLDGFNQICSITTSGNLSQFLISGLGSPGGMAVGPDGNLWFSDYSAVYRMTPDTIPSVPSHSLAAQEGYYSAPVASISTPDPAALSSSVNWGNGQTTPATLISNQHGGYDVVAATTFTKLGTFPVTITIHDPLRGQSIIHSYVTVKPSRAANFLTAIYEDLLGRQPDSNGMAWWLSKLGQGSTRTDVVLGFEASREYRLRLIDNLYTSILGRHVEGTGEGFFLQQLQSGATVEQIKSQIFGSVEYFQLSGGTYLGFLSALYQNVLGRAIDGVGAPAGYMALAAGATPAALALQVIDSQEAAGALVTGLYGQLLNRKPEQSALGQWKALLQHGISGQALLAEIAGSDEFFARF